MKNVRIVISTDRKTAQVYLLLTNKTFRLYAGDGNIEAIIATWLGVSSIYK